jgi:hypothetical protein
MEPKSQKIDQIKKMTRVLDEIVQVKRTKAQLAQKKQYEKKYGKGKIIEVGDLVGHMNRNVGMGPGAHKLKANWKGPYMVTQANDNNTIMIEDQNGDKHGPINLDKLKKSKRTFIRKRQEGQQDIEQEINLDTSFIARGEM